MDVNKIKILNSGVDRDITIPISQNFDLMNRGDSVEIEKVKIVDNIIGKPTNYELARYSMASIGNVTKIIYKMYLITSNPVTLAAEWNTTYLSGLTTFEVSEIEYLNKNFVNSFFKLDFYDSKDLLTQKIFFTVILNCTSGIKQDDGGFYITVPIFELDHFGTQEGYYIYWYEDISITNLSEMYFGCKFFNGKTGQFYGFVNQPNLLGVADSNTFFYKLTFDYNSNLYSVYDTFGNVTNEISFYQYLKS
jgi:hypothetical protein